MNILQFLAILAVFFLVLWIGVIYVTDIATPEGGDKDQIGILYKVQKLKEELKVLMILGKTAEALFVQAQLKSLVGALNKGARR